MMAASSAFSNLSSELSSNAASYESVISQLTGSEWTGPSSEAMAASAQPYITWLTTTSAQLQEAATKAIVIGGGVRGGLFRQHPARGRPRQPDAAGCSSSRPTSWAKTPRRSRPTRPCMASSGRRMPPRCTATPQRLGSLRDADTVDPAGPKHQPSRAGTASVGGQQRRRQQRRPRRRSTTRWVACKTQRVRPPTRQQPSGGRTPPAPSCQLSTVCSAHRSWATAFTTSVSRWPGTSP